MKARRLIKHPYSPLLSLTDKLYMPAKLAEQFGICYNDITPKSKATAQRHYSGINCRNYDTLYNLLISEMSLPGIEVLIKKLLPKILGRLGKENHSKR